MKKNLIKTLLWLGLVQMTFLGATSLTTTAAGGDALAVYQGERATFYHGDVIRGLVMFKDGFTISKTSERDPYTVQVTWDAHGIVDGMVKFNAANPILELRSDLAFGTGGGFQSTDDYTNPALRILGNNKTIVLGGPVSLGMDTLLCSGNWLNIDGRGNSLSCTSSFGQFNGSPQKVGDAYGSLLLRGMRFVIAGRKTFNWGIFRAFQDIVLENMTIDSAMRVKEYAKTYMFDYIQNRVSIRGKVALQGAGGIFTLSSFWDSTKPLIIKIEKNSELYIGKGVILDVEAKNGNIRFEFEDASSVLHFDGCDFYTGADGLTLTKGTVMFENKVRIFNKNYDSTTPNTDMAKALTFGDGTPEGAMDVKVLGSAYVTVEGCMASK